MANYPEMMMKRVKGMLLLGSAGRNSGKTEFACALLRRLSPEHEIIGIKVTTVNEKNGVCPRGGQGCGVCSSFEGRYFITGEADQTLDKDTSRLLAAGAKQVYWLRVLAEHLAEGLDALLEQLKPGGITICESNSLRLVAQPDLFLMMKLADTSEIKESAAKVTKYADRVVISDGENFDLAPDLVHIKNEKWTL